MSAPAGWYPDPSDPARERWWDGAQWTGHQQTPAQTPAQAPAPRYGEYAPAASPLYSAGYPVAPAYAAAPAYAMPAKVQVDTNTVWVWLAIVASVLPFTVLFLIDWNGYIDVLSSSARSYGQAAGVMQWEVRTLAVSSISWIAIGAYIVFCWLDWRELRKRGVPAPFHWGWSFFALISLGLAVYMIGRAVVLGRRTVAGGRLPLWVWIGVTVVAYIIAFVWIFSLMGEIFQRIAGGYVGA